MLGEDLVVSGDTTGDFKDDYKDWFCETVLQFLNYWTMKGWASLW